MITADFVIALSLLVQDGAGHTPKVGISKEGATAIVGACSKVRGAEPGASAMCAAVLVVQAFRESGYRLDAIGDGGKSHGPFQTRATPKTWEEAVKIYLPLLQYSAATCVEPLAMVASGSCTNKAGIAISKARMAEARRISVLVECPK